MMEPAVTLTNFILTAECWAFALMLRGTDDKTGLLPWFSGLFAALGLAALLGGITHGFVAETDVGLVTMVWTGNMLAIGGAGVATAMIAARVGWPGERPTGFALGVAVLGALYALTVVFVSQDFLIALAGTVVPVIFLLVMLVRLYRRSAEPGVRLAIAGLVVNMAGGVQQQLGLGIDPEWFNHNAVFHVIQMLAFLLLYLGSRPTSAAVSRLRA